jgi:mannose-6-phosphate isomerase-like protein (cupin superfamily)
VDGRLFVLSGAGLALVNGKRAPLKVRTLLFIERKDRHEIKCSGRTPLRTLNIYVPPGYTKRGKELPGAKP